MIIDTSASMEFSDINKVVVWKCMEVYTYGLTKKKTLDFLAPHFH